MCAFTPRERLGSAPRYWLIGCLLILSLAGCQKVELYSELSEREGNDILAVLLTHGIAAEKLKGKAFVSVSVPQDEVARAIEILRRNGFPREKFTDLGQIFEKQGLISSPMEERVRYTFGLSQMLAETLTQIDGVLSARVIIVLPESAPFGKETLPPSASVFIKYLPGSVVDETVPRIKTLVQNSVDGLTYDNISVALFAGADSSADSVAADLDPAPLPPEPSQGRTWPLLAAALAFLLMLSVGVSAWLWMKARQGDKTFGMKVSG